MPYVTCHYPGGYSGVREPGGNPRLRLDLAEGETCEVSAEKAAQLLRDFPGYFTTDQAPAPRAATVTEPADVPAQEPPADEAPAASEPTEAAPRRRATTRRK